MPLQLAGSPDVTYTALLFTPAKTADYKLEFLRLKNGSAYASVFPNGDSANSLYCSGTTPLTTRLEAGQTAVILCTLSNSATCSVKITHVHDYVKTYDPAPTCTTDGVGKYTCSICGDPARHNGQICVVRDPRDVAAMERTHEYSGLYHVLHGTLSPMNGIGPDQIRIRELLARLDSEKVDEVILATNPDVEGEATASYLGRLLKARGVRCTRIAHGVPVGGDLEYTDEVTLSKALEGRREME